MCTISSMATPAPSTTIQLGFFLSSLLREVKSSSDSSPPSSGPEVAEGEQSRRHAAARPVPWCRVHFNIRHGDRTSAAHMLQDRGKSTPASVRQVLLDLASCCRCEDAKASILTDGLGPLLALASDDQECRAARRSNKGWSSRAGSSVSTRAVSRRGGGRRRAKILKRGLELVDLLSHTAESKEQERQTIVIKQILVMMIRTDDDVSVLVRATDTLGRFVDGSLQRIQVAAQEHAIAILIDLLKLVQTGESNLDLKRTALCVCLRMETRAREVEFGVVRLLLRLVRDAQVYGQIVHEEMAPLLFRVIEHNSNIREVIAATCTIIADLSDFARQCKLDLSPFVKDCNGKMLVLAATCHAQEASVVDNTFRFFVNVSNNPVDLPHLINSETIEGLLSLYVLAGGSGYLAELAGHLCHDKSVHGITGYIGIAVEILCRTIPSSKSWKDQTADIINFIREMMLSKDGADVVMSCGGKDLLEVLHTNIDVQEDNPSTDAEMSCDHRGPSTTTPLSLSSSNFGGGRIASTVVNMLENAVLGLSDLSDLGVLNDISSDSSTDDQLSSSRIGLRLGDAEYDDYVSRLLHLESSCHFKKRESRGNIFCSEPETTFDQIPSEQSCGEALQEKYDSMKEPAVQNLYGEEADASGDNAEEENDDDSDDEEDNENIEKAECTGDEVEVPSLYSIPLSGVQSPRNSIASKTTRKDLSTVTFFDHLEDKNGNEGFSDLDSGLTFDSNFESGNLDRAIRIGQFEYDLVLRHDFKSSGHMQWFYFAVSNIQSTNASPRGGQKYRFNIVNLCKSNSLFNQGLQPVVYSVRDAHQKGKGWVRSGTDIYYFANSFVRPPRNAASIQGVAPRRWHLQSLPQHQQLHFHSSRVHPGESQASWMMRGVIDFLLGSSGVACVLRRMFVFQIIPMLNPDVSKDKETTARVVVANELRINWSFTLEASFCGASFGELYNMHFNTKHLREVGTALCETIFQALCIPQQVELYLREAGVIGEKYPADEEANPRSSFLKFLKGKAASVKKISNEATPKGVRRKGSKARAIATSDAGTSKATDTNEGSGIRRRLSRQQIKSTSCASGLLDRVTPDTSVPTDSTNCLDLACIPPPKLSGRKLRSKYPKVRRTKSSPDGHVKSRRRAIPSLVSNAGVDNSEDSEAANDSVMPLVAPSKLSAAVSGPPSSSVRVPLSSFQGSESTYMRSSRTTPLPFPSTILGMQLRDSSVLLPSPVGDGMTRSPKAPASRIRFR
ncbi:Armadillo-type fold [Phytophthora cactorum]|nr:Armadillo-type fold [Phytophthora cactorum]